MRPSQFIILYTTRLVATLYSKGLEQILCHFAAILNYVHVLIDTRKIKPAIVNFSHEYEFSVDCWS